MTSTYGAIAFSVPSTSVLPQSKSLSGPMIFGRSAGAEPLQISAIIVWSVLKSSSIALGVRLPLTVLPPAASSLPSSNPNSPGLPAFVRACTCVKTSEGSTRTRSKEARGGRG